MLIQQKISGIYKWINKVNGHYYVGSSKEANGFRKRQHINDLKRNCHHSIIFQRAWNKYGEDNFEFIIVENMPDATEQELLDMEQKYLDIAKLERNKSYNISFTANRPEMTEETKEKLRQKSLGRIFSKESREKMRLSHLGIPRKEETKAKLRLINTGEGNGFYGKKHTKEALLIIKFYNQKNAKRGNKHYAFDHNLYKFFNKNTNEIFIGTKYDFRLKFELESTKVSSICNGKRKSHKGWIVI